MKDRTSPYVNLDGILMNLPRISKKKIHHTQFAISFIEKKDFEFPKVFKNYTHVTKNIIHIFFYCRKIENFYINAYSYIIFFSVHISQIYCAYTSLRELKKL